MRLDKFLKVTHLVKRREVSHDFIKMGKALVNEKVAKPATMVKVGDIVTLNVSEVRVIKFRILKVVEHCPLKECNTLYEMLINDSLTEQETNTNQVSN